MISSSCYGPVHLDKETQTQKQHKISWLKRMDRIFSRSLAGQQKPVSESLSECWLGLAHHSFMDTQSEFGVGVCFKSGNNVAGCEGGAL